MKNTTENPQEVKKLFDKAKTQLLDDMKTREIGAIIWDNSRAGFHFIPEIEHVSSNGEKRRTARIMGLYNFKDTLYLIEEDRADIRMDDFYQEGVEVAPVVVTLTEDVAVKDLGDPTKEKGYTTQGSLEEWLAIADCYFEALNEK